MDTRFGPKALQLAAVVALATVTAACAPVACYPDSEPSGSVAIIDRDC